eukprot:GHVR01191091.1.p1 GENE.GHVR01191091.1~~GHVR01191091.1.p1  ORF type:complete len:467 (+),score=179.68 GHVR01191091.1:283-1683(+)
MPLPLSTSIGVNETLELFSKEFCYWIERRVNSKKYTHTHTHTQRNTINDTGDINMNNNNCNNDIKIDTLDLELFIDNRNLIHVIYASNLKWTTNNNNINIPKTYINSEKAAVQKVEREKHLACAAQLVCSGIPLPAESVEHWLLTESNDKTLMRAVYHPVATFTPAIRTYVQWRELVSINEELLMKKESIEDRRKKKKLSDNNNEAHTQTNTHTWKTTLLSNTQCSEFISPLLLGQPFVSHVMKVASAIENHGTPNYSTIEEASVGLDPTGAIPLTLARLMMKTGSKNSPVLGTLMGDYKVCQNCFKMLLRMRLYRDHAIDRETHWLNIKEKISDERNYPLKYFPPRVTSIVGPLVPKCWTRVGILTWGTRKALNALKLNQNRTHTHTHRYTKSITESDRESVNSDVLSSTTQTHTHESAVEEIKLEGDIVKSSDIHTNDVSCNSEDDKHTHIDTHTHTHTHTHNN